MHRLNNLLFIVSYTYSSRVLNVIQGEKELLVQTFNHDYYYKEVSFKQIINFIQFRQ